MDSISNFSYTIFAIGSLAFLMLVQILIADFVSIRSKHVPGFPVPSDHDNFLFRSSRVVANSNETIAIFILATIFCIFSNAWPLAVAFTSWAYFIARVAYTICYYSNLKILRSVVFGISLLVIAAQIVIGLSAWL